MDGQQGEDPMRVLCVDDEPAMRLVVRCALAEDEVVEAPTVPEAERLLVEDAPFDVVLLDMMLPGVSGIELLRGIRSSLRFPDLPVVVFTALSAERSHRLAFDVGADAYVTKPFDVDALRPRLLEVVGRSAAERARARRDEAEVAHLLALLDEPPPPAFQR
jgi:DNA-binding response OmpR family regulator